jgi:Uncharacterized protein conserved in bacteria (DUF2130)
MSRSRLTRRLHTGDRVGGFFNFGPFAALATLAKLGKLRIVVLLVFTGARGADIMQRVTTASGKPAGVILYETKRTKNWSDGWLIKLKEDMRKTGARIGVIVTETLPADMLNTAFALRDDDVGVCDLCSAIVLARVLRRMIEREAEVRISRESGSCTLGGSVGRSLWWELPIAPEVFVPFVPTGPVLVPVLGPGGRNVYLLNALCGSWAAEFQEFVPKHAFTRYVAKRRNSSV